MNLQVLYDLKERLEHAAIAGTGLLHEDFRLRRAAEALAPLAKANPVFAKISAGIAALLNAPEQERGTRLLDVLSLVDAVVYTQGVTSVPGDLEDPVPGTGRYLSISYGTLQPLLAALSGTGSGRTAVIREVWENHPEYFGDFRVLPHVVGALRENYEELEELIQTILMKQGRRIVPLLKEGFDPAGKAEMVRRVRLITWLCGEEENDWLVSVLPESKKDVREAIIRALCLCQRNTDLLLDLCRSERGKLKEVALGSLACMDDVKLRDFWMEELKKHPGSAAALAGTDTGLAAELSTAALKAELERLLEQGKPLSSKELDHLLKLLDAFCGKNSQEVRDFWHWVGENMERMHEIKPEKNVRDCDCSLAELMQRCFLMALLRSHSYGMLQLAGKLRDKYPRWFLCGGLMADLLDLDCPPEITYERYSSFVTKNTLLRPETEEERWNRVQIMQVLGQIGYDAESRLFFMVYARTDQMGYEQECRTSLRWFDPRWAILLADHHIPQELQLYNLRYARTVQKIPTRTDELVMSLCDPTDVQACAACGAYLYQRVKITGEFAVYLDALIRCGWKNWKGLIAHCAQKESQVPFHYTVNNLMRIPISNRERAEELRELNGLVSSGRVSAKYGRWPEEQVWELITRLENDENIELF